jgi:glycosyltransferase involved in cell wall biosynthesis
MISIVIAVSNNENTIVECVNSVLTQNFNKYEVILVLNNSSDNTKLIIEKNFLKKKKIKFFVIKKVGPSAARNFGIRNSKMKYILFLDADDLLMPGCLLYLSNQIKKKNVNALYNSHAQLSSHYYKKKKNDGINTNRFFSTKQIKNYLIKFLLKPNIFSAFVHCWGNLYNRKFLIKNKIIFNESLSNLEDIIFNVSVFKNLKKIYYCNKITYIHRIYSITGRQSFKIDKTNINSILTTHKFLNFFLKDVLKKKHNVLKHYIAWNIVNLLIRLSKSEINFQNLNNFINELFANETIKKSVRYYIFFREYNVIFIYFLKYRLKTCLLCYLCIYNLYNRFIYLLK